MTIGNIIMALILISFMLILIGIALIFFSTFKESTRKHVEGGGVIIIGPLPIVFGTSEKVTKTLIILAIVLVIVVFVIFIAMNYLWGVWR